MALGHKKEKGEIRKMNRIVIGALSAVALLAGAQEGTMTSTMTSDSPVKVYTNVDLSATRLSKVNTGTSNSASNFGYNLTAGLDGVYMFDTTMGASLGADFNMIKGSKDSFTISNNYLDIPVNFVYAWQAGNGLNSMFGIGPFAGIALNKWKVKDPSGATTDIKAKTALGLNIENHTTWEITPEFALGGHLGFKYAFNDLVDEKSAGSTSNETQNYFGVSLGISARFL